MNEENLIAAVIAFGYKEEGERYLKSPGGRWWLGLVGITGEAAIRTARQVRAIDERDALLRAKAVLNKLALEPPPVNPPTLSAV